MAFTMKDINLNKKTVKEELSDYSKLIYTYKIFTDKLRLALWEYVKFRLFKRKYSKFSVSSYKQMIDDLLVYCVDKKLEDISFNDVKNNEAQLINEIGRAIYYGNLHNLYLKSNDLSSLELAFKNKQSYKEIRDDVAKSELVEYFRSLMV